MVSFVLCSRLTEMLTSNWELSGQLRVPAAGKTQVRDSFMQCGINTTNDTLSMS